MKIEEEAFNEVDLLAIKFDRISEMMKNGNITENDLNYKSSVNLRGFNLNTDQ